MLTSPTVQAGQVAAPGYGSKNAADKTGPAPRLPNWPSEKGIMVPRSSFRAPPDTSLRASWPESTQGNRPGSGVTEAAPTP
jgi:hypothetical protein